MKISQRGIDLIKKWEGLRLTAYKALPSERFYTIGYGHYGADVKHGQAISKEQAESLLRSDLKSYESRVLKYNPKYNFNQNQFDALVSFCYNIGNIDQLTANGTRSIAEISAKIPEYCRAGGKRLQGLVNRRLDEKRLFDKADIPYSVDDLARQVIAGQWGNGEERKKKLKEAGYFYDVIQKRVNEILKGR